LAGKNMKKLITLLLMIALNAGATDTYLRYSLGKLVVVNGVIQVGAGTVVADYAWDSAYSDSVMLWELSSINSSTPDTSYIGTNNGTLGAGGALPTFSTATGGVSSHMTFDGGDYISSQDDVYSSFGTNDFSFQLWIYPTTLQQQGIVKKGFEYVDIRDGFSIYEDATGHIVFSIEDANAGTESVTSVGTVSNNVWAHIAVSRSGATGKVYLNGVLDISSNCFTSSKSVSSTYDPQFFRGDGNTVNYFAGKADRPTLYNKELTANEVLSNFWYTATDTLAIDTNDTPYYETALDAGGHGWTQWDYDNRNGLYTNLVFSSSFDYDSASDQSLVNNQGTLANTTFVSTNNNGYFAFNGTSSRTDYPWKDEYRFTDGTNDSAFTITAWVRMVDATKFRIVARYGTVDLFQISTSAGDLMYWDIYGVGAVKRERRSVATQTADQNKWVHWAFVYCPDATTKMIEYKNAVNYAITTNNSGAWTHMKYEETQPLTIGTLDGSDFANGYIDEVRMFSGILTPTQVTNLWQAGTNTHINP